MIKDAAASSPRASPDVFGEPKKTQGFQPSDCTQQDPSFFVPSEQSQWISVLSTPCPYPAVHFHTVMENLLRNPNVTSTHLFRAEILYDSDSDGSDYQPIRLIDQLRGFAWRRTVVRKLIPRNPNLDRPLPQTCHYFHSSSAGIKQDAAQQPSDQKEGESNLVIYLPHVSDPSLMPFYHPQASAVATLHAFDQHSSRGSLSIHYRPFPSQEPGSSSDLGAGLSDRLSRTALHLLQVIHKHMAGRAAGYTKRVHHDQIIPQTRLQDTYTRLKLKYAKYLITQWVESTDPSKHVFEDLGIAAFLIELWRDMYGPDREHWKGFVDVGCGNGVLVYILRSEGYTGWGFDARRRKTWSALGEDLQSYLKEMVLIPEPMQHKTTDRYPTDIPRSELVDKIETHDGQFPEGTFIISNHADELTLWTPLLACLTNSPFIAIPCCSHNFDGARFRAPANRAKDKKKAKDPGQPSAYASLCEYLSWLTAHIGYEAENEVLRIPSTRNTAILGRTRTAEPRPLDERRQAVMKVVEGEVSVSIHEVHEKWVSRMGGIIKKPCGH
ncbi:DUF1613-domain-containing protein [Eremomyces bilateralis CBS 781.70]|uniref:tRNA (uracil-O(2)-)-methyltransferase n=1 Tax=Eremomyces bilateralis CBS 781.70 TaxID=1392243 RepID=A0A6G1G3S9_9PEZI|nr:DUF1613-domain-containing protein [Eremomyces bilateralis CBS 781.70]KAF1812713.1 DUF1613-domain-containing protein [Eremomyces bilateralis CBS 781.70]